MVGTWLETSFFFFSQVGLVPHGRHDDELHLGGVHGVGENVAAVCSRASAVHVTALHALTLRAPTHHIPSQDRISTTRKPQRGARQRRTGVCWPAARPWPPGSPPAASCCFWVRATRTPRPPDGPQRREASFSPAEERSLPRAQSPALSCPSSAARSARSRRPPRALAAANLFSAAANSAFSETKSVQAGEPHRRWTARSRGRPAGRPLHAPPPPLVRWPSC